MTERKKTYGELRESVSKIHKWFKAWENAVEAADMVIASEETVSKLETRQRELQSDIKRQTAALEGLDSKVEEFRHEINMFDSVIKAKEAKVIELDNYLAGGYKNKETRLLNEARERVAEEETGMRKVVADLKAEAEQMRSQRVSDEKRSAKAKSELATIRKAIGV